MIALRIILAINGIFIVDTSLHPFLLKRKWLGKTSIRGLIARKLRICLGPGQQMVMSSLLIG